MNFVSSGIRVVLLLACATVAAVVIASTAAASVGRPPDVADAAAAVTASTAPAAAPVSPPDVRDAAVAARFTAPATSSGFHWGDFAAGIGTGIGSALILGGVLAAGAIARRKRLSPA